MGYCPSQDWDTYAAELENEEAGSWIWKVSNQIAQVDPRWEAEAEATNALIGNTHVTWANGIKCVMPHNDDIEYDSSALIIRTLHMKGHNVKIFPVSGKFAIFMEIPEASPKWCVVPGTEGNETELNSYLAFCLSDRSINQN